MSKEILDALSCGDIFRNKEGTKFLAFVHLHASDRIVVCRSLNSDCLGATTSQKFEASTFLDHWSPVGLNIDSLHKILNITTDTMFAAIKQAHNNTPDTGDTLTPQLAYNVMKELGINHNQTNVS